MQLTEARAEGLKTWITRKLDDISDADSDVLADYVLELLRADVPATGLRRSVVENLQDFLGSHTTGFVDQLLKAVYAPLPTLNIPVKPTLVSPAGPVHPSAFASGANAIPSYGSAPADASRKRTFNGAQGPANRERNERGGRNGRGGPAAVRGHGGRIAKANGPQTRQNTKQSTQAAQAMPFVPEQAAAAMYTLQAMSAPEGQGMPFDPQAAAAALLTLEQMGMQMPPLPSMGPNMFMEQDVGSMWSSGGNPRAKGRCKDYDTLGICQRGAKCPYLHDASQIIMPFGGGDHSSATLAGNENVPPGATQQPKNAMARDNANGQRRRVGPPRRGPGGHPNNTTILVQNIPEEYMDHEPVQDFFATFGPIDQIVLSLENSSAVVTYKTHEAAKAAYESPKVIFDNRFVKVHWYSANKHRRFREEPTVEADSFDREAFERELEEHQKRFDQRKVLKDETDAKVAEIQQQRGEVERKREEERQRLLAKIREKRPSEDVADDAKSSTEFLRAKLKWLEEEAESLGLQPEPWASTQSGRGRGAYQGRGHSHGARRGRGGLRRGELPAGGAYNLDNRPRAVKVDGVEFDSEKDEALRQHLISIGEFSSIEADSSGTAQTITFKDRLTAERFFYGPRNVPGVGDLELSWVKTPSSVHHATSHVIEVDMSDADEQEAGQDHEDHYAVRENGGMDYEDEER